MVFFALLLAALLLVVGGQALARRSVRTGAAVVLPIVFLAIPILQSIPLPMGVRRLLDPGGTSLLAEHAFKAPASWPLSLDPPITRGHIGKAAAALIVFAVAYHMASGRRDRYLVCQAIGLAGVAAVAIGLLHKIVGAPKIYGLFSASDRALLTGPFVNANHTAEFLELAAFVCVACALQRPTALNRVGWLVGALLCAGGAAATLSRGAVLAVGAAVVVFALLRYLFSEEKAPSVRRSSLAWTGLVLGMVVLTAASLGANQILDRFRSGAITGDTRFRLWRDAWSLIEAHPFGIGRGAFDRVFPIYRTLQAPTTVRFAFVENHPLQLLLDSGWLLYLGIAAAFAFVVAKAVKQRRGDAVEAALAAGLVAVLTHGLVDFGLETLGVLLPFMAILATLLGRMHSPQGRSSPLGRTGLALGGIGVIVGLVSVVHPTFDDFDALLKRTPQPQEKTELLRRAQMVRPLDYFYALSWARLQPLRPPGGGPSPRFRALNRALALCPRCEAAHVEVARNLWALGKRRQALLEWRSAVAVQPNLLPGTLSELFAAGAKAEELASIATFDPARMIVVSDFLSAAQKVPDAMIVLDQAEAAGAPRKEVLISRARLQLRSARIKEAAATVAQASAAGFRDPRLVVTDAELRVQTRGEHGPDEALAVLEAGAAQYPNDVDIHRLRLDIVTRFEKWQSVERAIEAFKHALYQNRRSVSEAHAASARISGRLSRWAKAIGEYRLALAGEPWNVGLWMELGRAAENAGRDTTAREAFGEADRLSPNDPEIRRAIEAVNARLTRRRSASQPHSEGPL